VVHNVEVTELDASTATPAPPGARPAPGADEPPPPKRSTVRRITWWVGIGMILAGLALLAYVAWQLWGTNWVSKRHQREITSNLQEAWESGSGKKPQFVPTGEASALIRIPKFGSKYVIPVLEGAKDGTISKDILSRGYGHFQTGGTTEDHPVAFPGDVGNYSVAAHRVTHGELLRRMPDQRPGDTVIVETVDATYKYKLDTNPKDLVIPFTGIWVLDALPTNPNGGVQPKQEEGQRLITLTTCSEIFHTDNRMIAFGHLVEVVPKKGDRTSG
jgi:sortase A